MSRNGALDVRLTREIEAGLDSIVDDMVHLVRDEVPELAGLRHPELWAALRRSAAADVRAGMAAFDARALPSRLSAGAEELTRAAAAAAVPVSAVLRAYRVAQGEYWLKVFDLIERLQAPPAEKLALIRTVTTFNHRYVDRLSTLGARRLQEERERLLRRRETVALALAREALAGGSPDLLAVGYDLGSLHVAVVISGEHAVSVGVGLADAHPGRTLVVSPEPGTCWAWFELGGGRDAPGAAASLPSEHALAAGRPSSGPEGFRSSHHQAVLAQEAGRGLGLAACTYADVAVEVLAGRDEAAARRFVADELGPLAGPGERMARLRESLLTYLAHGQSTAAASAAAGCSPRTLGYRLRRAEELLGRPAAARSAELHMALRLFALAGGRREAG